MFLLDIDLLFRCRTTPACSSYRRTPGAGPIRSLLRRGDIYGWAFRPWYRKPDLNRRPWGFPAGWQVAPCSSLLSYCGIRSPPAWYQHAGHFPSFRAVILTGDDRSFCALTHHAAWNHTLVPPGGVKPPAPEGATGADRLRHMPGIAGRNVKNRSNQTKIASI